MKLTKLTKTQIKFIEANQYCIELDLAKSKTAQTLLKMGYYNEVNIGEKSYHLMGSHKLQDVYSALLTLRNFGELEF